MTLWHFTDEVQKTNTRPILNVLSKWCYRELEIRYYGVLIKISFSFVLYCLHEILWPESIRGNHKIVKSLSFFSPTSLVSGFNVVAVSIKTNTAMSHPPCANQTKVIVIRIIHLIHGAENMGIILLEAAHTGKACQGSWQLIPVQNAKVCHAKGQLSPGAWTVIKHQTVVKQTELESNTN